jgi:hypothetical protein
MMYQGDLYTVTLNNGELASAYYEDSENKVCNPSLLNDLEYYISTGLHSL